MIRTKRITIQDIFLYLIDPKVISSTKKLKKLAEEISKNWRLHLRMQTEAI